MPNYDIIPLATDLLDYTIQRVKVKEPQYTKVKAYVMENGQMVEKELFEKIKDDGKHVVMCHYPIPFFRAGYSDTAYMLYGHVHRTKEYEYLTEMRKSIRAKAKPFPAGAIT